MSIIEKLVKVVNEGDTNGAKEVMHDDFKFLMHSSGKTLSKDDVGPPRTSLYADSCSRCLKASYL